MPRTEKDTGSNSAKNSKDSKKPMNARAMHKKRGSTANDDDDEVDSKGNIRGLIAYTEEEEEEESPRLSRRGFKPRKAAIVAKEKIKAKLPKEEKQVNSKNSVKPKLRKYVSEEETSISEDEDEDKDEDEDEDEDETTENSEEYDDDDEDDEDEDEDDGSPAKMILNFGFGGGEELDTRMVPKRYKIKKESEDVQKFFKLMTEPVETETIDDHIDQFKALKEDEKKRMLTALENRPKTKEQPVMFKILNMQTTPEIQAQLLSKYNNLQALDPASGEYYKMRNWLEKATALHLGVRKQMPVKVDDGPEVCSAFMTRARKCLDEAIF
jgi:hypothetical protein